MKGLVMRRKIILLLGTKRIFDIEEFLFIDLDDASDTCRR